MQEKLEGWIMIFAALSLENVAFDVFFVLHILSFNKMLSLYTSKILIWNKKVSLELQQSSLLKLTSIPSAYEFLQ